MFPSTRSHNQGTSLHVSFHKGSESGNILTCFDPHGITNREHSNIFLSTGYHNQGTFLHVSNHKVSQSGFHDDDLLRIETNINIQWDIIT